MWPQMAFTLRKDVNVEIKIADIQLSVANLSESHMLRPLWRNEIGPLD